MRVVFVVVSPPVFGEHLRLQQGEKEFLVEQFVAEATIQRFDVGVLPRRPGLDQGCSGARQVTPVLKSMRGEFRTVVGADEAQG